MKLKVEQEGGPFYDGGEAPAQVAAESMGPQAVVVDSPAEAESPTQTEPDQTEAEQTEAGAEPAPPMPGPPMPAPPMPAPQVPAPPMPAPAPQIPAPRAPGVPVPGPTLPRPDLTIDLARRFNSETRREEFRLLRRIGYDDPEIGSILVPADLENWTTDLTSVPAFLTWLVPKTGAHLPAAILHDGLVLDDGEPASYIAEREIHRDEADRIFRDAMAQTGTGLIRRWLVWAAVTAATMHHGRQVAWTPRQKLHYWLALWGSITLIVLLGAWAISDVLEAPWRGAPWIGEEPWQELVGGVAGGIVLPLLLGCTWGKFRIAGWIIGPLVALVVPAVVPILLVGGLYVGIERLADRRPGLLKVLAVGFVGSALGVFVAAWWVA